MLNDLDRDVLVINVDDDDDLVEDVPLQDRMTLAEHHQRTHLILTVINLYYDDDDDDDNDDDDNDHQHHWHD